MEHIGNVVFCGKIQTEGLQKKTPFCIILHMTWKYHVVFNYDKTDFNLFPQHRQFELFKEFKNYVCHNNFNTRYIV